MRLTYPKCTPFWHNMLKIATASGAPPQTPLGGLTTLLRPSSHEGLLAFGNRSFTPSALALSPFCSRSVLPKGIYRFTPLPIGHDNSQLCLRQGGIPFPVLFALYVNGLIEKLSKSKYGRRIGDMFLDVTCMEMISF